MAVREFIYGGHIVAAYNGGLISLGPATWEETIETSLIEADGQGSDGFLRLIGSASKPRIYRVGLTFRHLTPDILAFCRGYLADEITTETIDEPIDPVTIPTGAPYEIVDATAITATTAPNIGVWIGGNTDDVSVKAKMLAEGSSPTKSGEVEVNLTLTKFIFHADDAGKSVTYISPVTVTTGKKIDADNPTPFPRFRLLGRLLGPDGANAHKIEYFDCAITETATLGTTGDAAAEMTVQVTASTPAGKILPYRLIFPKAP